jgi:dienelactone hydrolase
LHFPVQGQRVTGTLCLPQGAPAPVVLMLHGFTGSRDEMAVTGTGEGVFSRSARRLAQHGLASLRIAGSENAGVVLTGNPGRAMPVDEKT